MPNAEQIAPLDGPSPTPSSVVPASPEKRRVFLSIENIGLVAGTAALIAIVLMPQPEGLSVVGQHMFGIFAFAVIVWMTEAVDYTASCIILMALIALLLGTAPDPARPGHLLGTDAALSAALAGFTNSAVALIAASLVIAAAMTITGLDKRLAFKVISVIGASRGRILIGIIIVMALLAFFCSHRLGACSLPCADHIRNDLCSRHRQEKPYRMHADDVDCVPVLDLGHRYRDRRRTKRLCERPYGENDSDKDLLDRLANHGSAVFHRDERCSLFRPDEYDGISNGRRSRAQRVRHARDR